MKKITSIFILSISDRSKTLDNISVKKLSVSGKYVMNRMEVPAGRILKIMPVRLFL